MRKINLGAKALELRQGLKLRTIVCRHRLKNLAEAFYPIEILQLCKGFFNARTGTSWDTDSNVVTRDLFHSGKDYRLTACALTDYRVHFPVANFRTVIDDGRPFINAAAFYALVLAHPFAVTLVSQGTRYFEE